MTDPTGPITEVYVVWHSETPIENVLGVFADHDKASAYMHSVRNDYVGGVFATLFTLDHGTKTDPDRAEKLRQRLAAAEEGLLPTGDDTPDL